MQPFDNLKSAMKFTEMLPRDFDMPKKGVRPQKGNICGIGALEPYLRVCEHTVGIKSLNWVK